MKKSLCVIAILIIDLLSVYAQNSCYSRLRGDTLIMGNHQIERTFIWNNGNLITYSLTNKATGKYLKSVSTTPDFKIMEETSAASSGSCQSKIVTADGIHPAYLNVTVSFGIGELNVLRSFRIYDDCPAIACNTYVKGRIGKVASEMKGNEADLKNIESVKDMSSKAECSVLDHLHFAGNHWHAKAVEFRDVTDRNDNLVTEQDAVTYRKNSDRGNLLFVQNGIDDNGFFFLKEAPCSTVQLNDNGADFITEFGDFIVTGLGLTSTDITPDKWTRTYGCVVGVFDESPRSALIALRNYQKKTRILATDRDEMIMENTWGDRSQDAKINEAFCLKELDCMSKLGITHFQLDDGWQTGKSPNSAVSNGSFKDIWRNGNYWTPDSTKFPNGLTPIVEKGRALGIKICLWFNPSIQNDFADWEKDADALIGLYRKYGISTFKIDGLVVPTKLAEENLRNLFNKVWEECGKDVSFNLDVTAGRREGYHYFNEYGNIFLENRYTDWGNYYPYKTLRNLWQLSKYVPAEKLQIEFLNKWRNADKYIDDPFAPANYSFDYLFATTMAGQPLAWFESSNLPAEGYNIKSLIGKYKKIQHDFHSGVILPIGDEPSGRSWTGFQSITSNHSGYFIVYRELNDEKIHSLTTWLNKGDVITLIPIAGNGVRTTCKAGEKGILSFTLPHANDFAVYAYQITGK